MTEEDDAQGTVTELGVQDTESELVEEEETEDLAGAADDADSSGGDETTQVEQKRRVFLQDGTGRHWDMTPEEMAHWAGYGITKAASSTGSEEGTPGTDETSGTTLETDSEIDDEDPLMKEIAQLKSQIDILNKDKNNRTEQERQELRNAANRRIVNQLGNKYAPKADKQTREMIEDRARRILSDAVEKDEVITGDQAYKQAAKFVADRLSAKFANYVNAKKETRAKATEVPGGASVISSTTAGKELTKEDQRRLAAEMRDGTVTKRAQAKFKELMSAAPA